MIWAEIIAKLWKPILGVVVLAAVALFSYNHGRKSVEPTVITTEKVVIQEKIVTVEVEKTVTNKTTKTTTKEDKDGNKETTTETVENSETETNKTKDSVSQKTEDSTPIVLRKSEYRLGVFAEFAPYAYFKEKDEKSTSWGISASKRLYGDLWIDGGYNFSQKSVTLGLSLEW